MHHLIKQTAVAAALAVMLSGCAFNREFRTPPSVESTVPRAVPAIEPTGHLAEIEIGREVGLTPDTFMARSTRPSGGALPDVKVRSLSVSESGLYDALLLMTEDAGIPLHVEGGPRALERVGAVAVHGMNGSLKAVLDNLSDAMGFFWSYEKGVLTVEPDRMFVVELPPVLLDDSLAGMSNTLVSLGARDPYLDRIARSLAFRANAKALEKIEKYLEQIRASRSLIVYQVQVYQVDLADVSTQGIQWNKLGGSNLDRPKLVQGSASPTPVSDLAKAFDLTRAASSLGVILAGPKFSLDVLIDFLKTQGTVKTVSQPRLAMLNGAKGTLRVGATATYVSKVGSNLSSGVSQVTAETRDLRTGLELSLVGEESDGTIYTRIALGLSELVRLNRFTTVGTDIALPEISDRDLQTVIRMPAGYTALLGGITITRNASDRSIGPVQNANNTEVKQSELVIVIRPTVVRFNTVAGAQPKAPPALPEMQPQSAPAAPPPAAPSRLTAQGELT